MADGVWKGVYPKVFGHSKQLSLNKSFDPSTPSMRKGRDGENRGKKEEKTDDHSGHYVINSSRPPDCWNAARSRQKMLIKGDGEDSKETSGPHKISQLPKC